MLEMITRTGENLTRFGAPSLRMMEKEVKKESGNSKRGKGVKGRRAWGSSLRQPLSLQLYRLEGDKKPFKKKTIGNREENLGNEKERRIITLLLLLPLKEYFLRVMHMLGTSVLCTTMRYITFPNNFKNKDTGEVSKATQGCVFSSLH